MFFGRYRKMGRLGRGGMGTVYKVEDTRLDGVLRALKLLRPELAGREDARTRIKREVKVAQGLDSRHIVRVHSYEEDDYHAGFVMEFLRGHTLAAHLAGEQAGSPFAMRDGLGHLPWVAALARQLAAALDHIHRRGFVHRDVKPANVMILDNGAKAPEQLRCKLLDFSVVWQGPDSDLTGHSQPGTMNFMAPELHPGGGGQPTAASDLFSFGKVLYWALTGDNPISLFELPKPSAVMEGLPTTVDEPLLSCFKRELSSRPTNAGVLADLFVEMSEQVLRDNTDLGKNDAVGGGADKKPGSKTNVRARWQPPSKTEPDDMEDKADSEVMEVVPQPGQAVGAARMSTPPPPPNPPRRSKVGRIVATLLLVYFGLLAIYLFMVCAVPIILGVGAAVLDQMNAW